MFAIFSCRLNNHDHHNLRLHIWTSTLILLLCNIGTVMAGLRNDLMTESKGDKLGKRSLSQTCDSTFLFSSCCNGCGYMFSDSTSLAVAVKDYLEDASVGIESYGAINCWDVSGVTSMKQLFTWSNFNDDIGCWDVSHVNDMSQMFYGAKSFNQASIGSWVVGQVTNMNALFSDAASFNQFIGDWDVSNVKYMSLMFARATAYNQPLNTWDVSQVVGLTEMFLLASSFNQSLNDWNVSQVLYKDCVFEQATAFDQGTCSWCADITQDDCSENLF